MGMNMTRKKAKLYIISQRNVNMATDNQHGTDACNKAIEALDKLDKIEALLDDSCMDESELLQQIRNIVHC